MHRAVKNMTLYNVKPGIVVLSERKFCFPFFGDDSVEITRVSSQRK